MLEFRDQFDELYAKNNKYYQLDYNFFQLRQKNKFGLK